MAGRSGRTYLPVGPSPVELGRVDHGQPV